MKPRTRSVLWVGALLAMLLASVLIGGGRGGAEAGPGGTLALRRFLAGMGRDVREAGSPPEPPATFVLLSDLRDARQAEPILDWVRGGGRLVLADPDSVLLDMLKIDKSGDLSNTRLRPGCAIPETRGVREIELLGSAGFGANDPVRIECFAGDGGAFMVAGDLGRGRVVVLGGVSPLTNEFLRRSDNAVLALRLIPAGPVVFGTPLPPGASPPKRGLWASLPRAARACIIELGLALVAFAFVRGRRLGRPVLEDPIVPVPSGEIAQATGRLLRSARASGYAGRELRRAMIGRLARRAGVHAASGEELVALLARAGVAPPPVLSRVLTGPDPRTDDDLIALGREIEQLRRHVEGVDAASVAGKGPQ